MKLVVSLVTLLCLHALLGQCADGFRVARAQELCLAIQAGAAGVSLERALPALPGGSTCTSCGRPVQVSWHRGRCGHSLLISRLGRLCTT
jgi:hypothetical protein